MLVPVLLSAVLLRFASADKPEVRLELTDGPLTTASGDGGAAAFLSGAAWLGEPGQLVTAETASPGGAATVVALWESADPRGRSEWTRVETLVSASGEGCGDADSCAEVSSPVAAFDGGEAHLFYTCRAPPGCPQRNGQVMHKAAASLSALAGSHADDGMVALSMTSGAGGPPDAWEGTGNCSLTVGAEALRECAGDGLQSFRPYRQLRNGTWLAMFTTADTVGLAAADAGLGGPWRRLHGHNPISTRIYVPGMGGEPKVVPIKDPVVTRTADGRFDVMVWVAAEQTLGFSYCTANSHAGMLRREWAAAQYLALPVKGGDGAGCKLQQLYALIDVSVPGDGAEPPSGVGDYMLVFSGGGGGAPPLCHALLHNKAEEMPPMTDAQHVARVDADGSGALSHEEVRMVVLQHRQKGGSKFVVSADHATHEADARAAATALLDKHDADGDGHLHHEELQQAVLNEMGEEPLAANFLNLLPKHGREL